jgi:nitrous oxidase accessory protein NosD
VPSNAYPTIQAAVDRATCTTINVAAGTYTGTYPGLVTIARDVMIRGAGEEHTVLDGGHRYHVVTIASGTVTIKGVTIQHGRASPLSGGAFSGGGIYNVGGGTVTLTEVTFENNIPNDCTGCAGLL